MSYTRRGRRGRDDDEESDYGEVIDRTGTAIDVRMLDKETEERLDRVLDGFGSEDEVFKSERGEDEDDGAGSDSSIDVRTPLP